MSETCRPGIKDLLQWKVEMQGSVEAALTHTSCPVVREEGMAGIPLPYQLRSDWMVTGILFLCFVLVSYVLSHGKRHLQQQFKKIRFTRERGSLFDDSTATDIRHTLALILQTCILSGFCVYDYFSDHDPVLFASVSHSLLLTVYIGFSLFYVISKWLIYNFVNWIFFNKTRNVIWLESYFNVLIGVGFFLFPLVLLVVYFNLSPQVAPYFVGGVIVIAKILLFYKCFTNFFNKIYGTFHLILYFCALEILPDLVLWQGILLANNLLILKF